MSTIAAISTPNAVGGIAVIRVSGPDALTVAARVFTPANGKPVSGMAGYTCAYGTVRDQDGNPVDDGICGKALAVCGLGNDADVADGEDKGGVGLAELDGDDVAVSGDALHAGEVYSISPLCAANNTEKEVNIDFLGLCS